jgi:hypothetical protein
MNWSIKYNFQANDGDHSLEFIFLESFDNHEFEIYYGTLDAFALIGVITAENDYDLTYNVNEIIFVRRLANVIRSRFSQLNQEVTCDLKKSL